MGRVVAEVVPLQVGSKENEMELPKDSHSGTFTDQDRVCVRWLRRKNRPRGSFLKRLCTCKTQGRQQCLMHRMEDILRSKEEGERVFQGTGAQALRKLRRYLRLMGVEHADEFTF